MKLPETKFIILLCAFFFTSITSLFADTFYGNRPTGFLRLKEYRYPVYLYVPEHYKPERVFPLIVSLPAPGEDPKKHIESWMPFAKRRGLIVLSCELMLRYTEVPYRTDLWLLRMKNEVASRYNIPEKQIFLIGVKENAHYAAYLGTNYPKEFSAVALLDGSWVGPLEHLLHLESRPIKQIPFFVMINEKDAGRAGIEEKALKLTDKGYPVYMELSKGKVDYSELDFRQRLLKWLREKGQSWQRVIDESQKSFKERFRKGLREFFQG